jgi:hypothetical protein
MDTIKSESQECNKIRFYLFITIPLA